jgi:HEAT repeat protein
MTLPASPNPALSGKEPTLSDSEIDALSGHEPLLGGLRRIELDAARLADLLNGSEFDRMHTLDFIERLGQASLYARELMQVIKPHARQKIGPWRGSFTLPQRLNAITALAHIGGADALDVLLVAMDDAPYAIKQAAQQTIFAICQRVDLTSPKSLKHLVRSLRVRSLSARRVIAQILSEAPAERVLDPLLRTGLTAEEWWARREAAWVLGKLGDRRATVRLIGALKDESAAVRGSAAWSLGQFDAPVALEALIAALADPDEGVRAAVATAFGAQINRMGRGDDRFQPLLDRLIEVIEKDTELPVRHAALDALGAIDAAEARAALKKYINRL